MENSKTVEPKVLKNYVVIILDKSGSMEILRKEVIGGFNDQLKTIREQNAKYGMQSLVSLVTFSTRVNEPTIWLGNVENVKELTYEDYAPDGFTAMYDAVGTTIEKLLAVPDANDAEVSFLVVVISDGLENNSHLYTGEKIAELISSVQKTGRWTISYIGANQDLSQVSKHLNININNTLSFSATSDGYTKMTGAMTDSTSKYYNARSVGLKSVSNLYSDKDEDKDTKNPNTTA